MSNGAQRITYYVYCKVPGNLPNSSLPSTSETIENAIGNLLHNQFENRIVSIEYRDKEFAFKVPITNATEGSTEGISAFDKKLLGLLNNYYKDIITKPLKLKEQFVSIFNIIPPFKIEHPKVALNFTVNGGAEVSLHDIHKAINPKDLALYVSAAVKVTGQVLGLLKMTNLQNLEWAMSNEPEWFKIVHRHFENNNDIIECQRELIIKDLDEYAEL
jgi:hypothetical protein